MAPQEKEVDSLAQCASNAPVRRGAGGLQSGREGVVSSFGAILFGPVSLAVCWCLAYCDSPLSDDGPLPTLVILIVVSHCVSAYLTLDTLLTRLRSLASVLMVGYWVFIAWVFLRVVRQAE